MQPFGADKWSRLKKGRPISPQNSKQPPKKTSAATELEMTLKVDTSRLHLQRRKNAEFNTLNETAAAPCWRTTVAYLIRGAASFRALPPGPMGEHWISRKDCWELPKDGHFWMFITKLHFNCIFEIAPSKTRCDTSVGAWALSRPPNKAIKGDNVSWGIRTTIAEAS